MLRVLLSILFNSKVVYYQCETDRPCFVSLYVWHTLLWVVVKFHEVIFETIVHNFPVLFKPCISLSDSHVDPTIDFGFYQVVLVLNILWYKF